MSISGKRLLLLSNSTNYGQAFLHHAAPAIRDFLGEKNKRVLFIPFAAVRFSHDDFTARVRDRFAEWGYNLRSVHESDDQQEAFDSAEAIVIGGGNTFQLLRKLYETDLLNIIRERVEMGLPYIGWSAGANVACPTIRTTNDMPIVEPLSLKALGLIPFQINPHYTDAALAGHGGETRAERLQEFIEVNPEVYVVGLREGSSLKIEGPRIALLGEKAARVFIKNQEARDYAPQESLQFLLHR